MALTIFRRRSFGFRVPSSESEPGTRNSKPETRPQDASLAQVLRSRDSARLRRYRELLDFYEGTHFSAGAARGRTRLVVNYARAVVDKGVAYLFGRGIRISVPPLPPTSSPLHSPEERRAAIGPLAPALTEMEHSLEGGARQAEHLLGLIAEENELDLVLLQAATNASVLGDAVLKIFWDAAGGRVRVVNVDPFCVFPAWASDDPTSLREVALVGRLTAAEARERYGVAGEGREEGVLETLEVWTAAELRLLVGGEVVYSGPNPLGFIPFVHVANLQPPNSSWGVSDLVDLVPLNRELNERMSDQADVIRYHADPPVVFRGVEEHSNLPVGPGTVWDLPRDADVALLEWRGSAPAVQEHIERLMRAIYDVTETPRTSFGDSGRLLSGVALETELQPLLQRTLRKRVVWSAALRRCVQMMLLLAERFDPNLEQGAFEPYRCQIVWPPMLPRDDAADARRNLALVQGGLRSHRRAMDTLGELDAELELQRVRADRAFLSGTPPPVPSPGRGGDEEWGIWGTPPRGEV